MSKTHIATFILHSTSHFYFTMLLIVQFSAAKVWLWIIIKKWGWIVIYNPTKNPIKLEENRCSPNAYTFYKNNLKQIRRTPARRKLGDCILHRTALILVKLFLRSLQRMVKESSLAFYELFFSDCAYTYMSYAGLFIFSYVLTRKLKGYLFIYLFILE